jgi:hypothetical protein
MIVCEEFMEILTIFLQFRPHVFDFLPPSFN